MIRVHVSTISWVEGGNKQLVDGSRRTAIVEGNDLCDISMK